ncbi:DUF4880 domain-containing protein [Duganella sp. FT80W]|uniref:DUF4880 domain-containing protein n=1 Tax=Duganella guangzhouensis TaxID=2666084 RepID=A0A6I2L9A2_9BURK|nr:DUF4880 domain-containing protein [Duganella guangzhouensis]MRW93276.1 DUF4880 domain-containing protein [Duganella guangzhouensis]
MDNDNAPDPIWDTAWAWVVREHERTQFDAAAREELQRWLAADERHCKQYEKACRLWMLSGLIPPAFGDESAN